MELSYELAAKKRLSIMSIDDNTNPNGICCGNMVGMCCSQKIMEQKEILTKTQEAYQVVLLSNCEGAFSDAMSTFRDTDSNTAPLINKQGADVASRKGF